MTQKRNKHENAIEKFHTKISTQKSEQISKAITSNADTKLEQSSQV